MHKEKSVPEIRFKSFDKDWNVKELKDLSNRVTRKNSNNQTNLPLTISAQDGLIDQRKYFSKQVASKNMNGYYLIKNGEFAYNKSYSKDFPLGAIKRLNKYSKGALSTLYIVFAIKELDIDFFESYLDSGHWHKEVYKRAAEGARNHGLLNIPVKDFFEINIYYPNDYKEQQKIGDLFEKLDQVISLQQQVLETTKEYKQSMLQKMFPKKGEKVPKIRFKEFKDNWQYSKFKNIADIFRGLTYKPSDLTNEQGTRVLRSSNIEVDQFRIFSDDVFVEDNAADIIPIEKNNIIITSANGSKNLVGKHAVVNQNIGKAVVGGFMYSVRTDYPYFLNSWMNTDLYSDVLRLVQGGGGSIGNLPINALKQQNILMPSMNERKKIGSFFKTLDEKIEQEEKKLETYQSMKKALMQRMFV